MKSLQLPDAPVSVADGVLARMSAVAAGVAVAAAARPALATAPVVLAAAAAAQQALTASAIWTGAGAVVVCGYVMEAETADATPAESLTVLFLAAEIVGQASVAAAVVTEVTTVSEPEFEIMTAICRA